MLDLSKQTTNTSSKRVQSWLDSMYYHHSSFDEDDKTSSTHSVKSSNAKFSTKLSSRSEKSSLSASSSSSRRAPSRRVYLRKPRLLVKRFRNKPNLKTSANYSDQSSSYFSGDSDDSNLFSNNGSSLFINENSSFSQQTTADIRASDLEFEDQNTSTNLDENNSNCSLNFSTKPHSFGILDFEQWDKNLKIDDNFKFVVKMYAFELKDIKVRVKGNQLIVKGSQRIEEKDGFYKREFQKSFTLKDDHIDRKNIKFDFDKNHNLVINVPRIHSVH